MQPTCRVMIVEDEALLALQLEDDLRECGLEVVGTAMSLAEGLALFERTTPDLALVDIHLADGPTGVDLAAAIAARAATPVVFMTANVKRIPPDFAGAVGVIGKPYTASGLRAAVDFIRAAMGDGAPLPPPPSLELAPRYAMMPDGMVRLVAG